MLKIDDQVTLQDWELTESFVRSGGPGGQNVNKVATAVELRFEAARSPNLSEDAKARLKRLAGRRWTRDGAIVIQCDETRSQARNREIARERLAELVRQALVRRRRRVPTKPTRAARRRRVDDKKKRGTLKSLRASPDKDDQT